MRTIKLLDLVIPLCLSACVVYADEPSAIQQKLVSQYALTQPSADNRDIVTAGAVLVLKKGPLTMGDASSPLNPYNSTYKDGKIINPAANAAKASRWLKAMSSIPYSPVPGASSAGNTPPSRTFVTNEKMWVTKIDVKDTGAIFYLFTDAYKDSSGNDVRYKTILNFPFAKGSTTDQVQKTVAEVFSVQPAENAKSEPKEPPPVGAGQQPGPAPPNPAAPPAAPQQASEAPPPPIAPPPPPADQPPPAPKTIAVGQSPDEVVAILGQPEKIIKLTNKQTYVYKDMKVIFVGGKVSDVQ